MSDKNKAYLVKDIPVQDWRDFKIKLLREGYDTLNEGMLRLIKKYANDEFAEIQE